MFDTDGFNTRTIGNFILERRDPFGFWYIKTKAGPVPQELARQSFTDTSTALNAIKVYTDKRPQKAEKK
jgi:hypothetical protein